MKYPKIFTPSRSLGARLTLTVTATILAIFVIITLFIYKATASSILQEANARYMGMLDNNNEHANATLKSTEVVLSNILPMVEKNLDNPDYMYSIVEQILAINPDIVGSAIAFEPNYYPEKGVQFAPYAYRDNDTIKTKQLGSDDYQYHYMNWYLIPKLLNKPYWSEPYYDINGGDVMMITYSLPLIDNKGDLCAIFTADISVEWISLMMQQTDSINNSSHGMGTGHSYSFIIGHSGTYISHPDPEMVLNETFFSHCMETPDSVDDYVGYEMIDGHRGYGNLDSKGQLIIYYAPIDYTNWSMAIVVPKNDIIAVVHRTGIIICGLMLLGLFIVFLVCNYMIGRVTNPLTRFASSANEIARGNFDSPLPDITTHDEMRYLHDSFETMQQSLVNQIEETRSANEQKGRIESELHIARSIQMAMLPKTFPPFPNRHDIDIYALLTPAKAVGGDLYDFYIRDEKLFFCIGDVSGKGVPASLVMAVTRTLFRTISANESRPEHVVSLINNAISEKNDMNMFVTLFTGSIDLQTGHMCYCNAGHDAPLLIPKEGHRAELLPTDSNLPVGVMAGLEFTRQETTIDDGTVIFLYTDGLTEAENIDHGLFGDERVLDVALAFSTDDLMSPQKVVGQMVAATQDFVGDAEQSDDLTLMAIRYGKKDFSN